MTLAHDIRCIPAECLGPRVCDTIRRDHERLTELRARRVADFFGQAGWVRSRAWDTCA